MRSTVLQFRIRKIRSALTATVTQEGFGLEQLMITPRFRHHARFVTRITVLQISTHNSRIVLHAIMTPEEAGRAVLNVCLVIHSRRAAAGRSWGREVISIRTQNILPAPSTIVTAPAVMI